MTEATYSFTIPSLHDDTPLDCRIYHQATVPDPLASSGKTIRGAIVGHPYAPLGGSYDDSVVLSVTECLLDQGYIVATFNFRGAGHSAGKTSWTGRPEIDDFSSIVGLLIYYLETLSRSAEHDILRFESDSMTAGTQSPPVGILLAGYSFASLILCRLPAVSTVVKRFENAEKGTSASEIFLRARILAKQRRQLVEASTALSTKPSRRGRGMSASPVIVGGEESDASNRRRSRGDSRGSVEVIRDLPKNIRSHMYRRSGHFHDTSMNREANTTDESNKTDRREAITVRYLLISPVLLPLSTTLVPPGLPFTASGGSVEISGVLSLKSPTLIAFGENDTFTSSKKLRQWAERLEMEAVTKRVKWVQVQGAGHFWREDGVMEDLLEKIREWDTKERGTSEIS